jgi:predicted MFS family arabinose efflux permease
LVILITFMNAIIRLLSIAGFVVTALLRVTDPLLPAIAQDYGASVANTAMIVTAYALAYGLFQILYGPLGDRIGKLRVIGGSLAITAVGTTACAAANSIESLAAFRFATGMTAAAVIPLSLAFFGDQVPYDRRQVTIGRYVGWLMMGQILGASLAGALAEYFSWRIVFILLGATAFVISIPIQITARQTVDTLPQEKTRTRLFGLSPYLHLLKSRPVRLLMSAVFFEGFFSYGGFAYLGAVLRVHLGLGYFAIGAILSGYGLGGIAYSMSVTWFVRRLGERWMVIIGSLVVAVNYVVFTFAPNWEFALFILLMTGMAFYMVHNTFQTLATEVEPGKRGVTLSLFAFTLFLGQGTGVALLGRVVASAGYTAMFLLCSMGIITLGLWFQSRLAGVKQHAGSDPLK